MSSRPPADAPMLTQRQLNRALLARQLLLEPAAVSIPKALEQIAGIQAQYAPSMYVGLWSRVAGFERDALTRALEERTVVQATLMRVTIHLVSARDFWPLALAVRRARQEWWLRTYGEEQEVAEASAVRLRKLIAGAPRTRKELDELIGGGQWHGADLWYDLVRVPPSGTWERRRADLYGSADEWIGPPATDPEKALIHLIRRYLGGFGPASAADIAGWAGMSVPRVRPALERLRLRRFRDEHGGTLLDLPGAPLPDPETPAPVRFLPTWDATLLVHARRTGILPERYRPVVFHVKRPHSIGTFLVDGAVAGGWRYKNGRVTLEPFDRVDAATRRALDREAEALAAFHG